MADNLGVNAMSYDNTDKTVVGELYVRRTATQINLSRPVDERYQDEPQPILVWFNKTLRNWKALFTTQYPDGMYYEVTCNAEKDETYVDVYEKQVQVTFPNRKEPTNG